MKVFICTIATSLALSNAFTLTAIPKGKVHSSVLLNGCRETPSEPPLPGPEVPVPENWYPEELDELIEDLNKLLGKADTSSYTPTAATITSAMCEVCNPVLTSPRVTTDGDGKTATAMDTWLPFRNRKKELGKDFFEEWTKYTPTPANPSKYIVFWDWLANTEEGRKFTSGLDAPFRNWFVRFLNLHGKWINSRESTSSLEDWVKFNGTDAHPFDINNYLHDETKPDGGFKSFNQFFLRRIKESKRPLEKAAKIVSPCDGGAFYLAKENLTAIDHQDHTLVGKSNDKFNLGEAMPGYGKAFVGGTLIDILLWFTDYHHFHCPVDGKVLHVGDYAGSYNYDFDNYDPEDPYAPKPPTEDSDRVGWYADLAKHKRMTFVIETEDIGLVAMIPVGFWGVGSIVSNIKEGDVLKKGDYMGHFGYGGSSIVLAFEPDQDLKFLRDIKNADFPRLLKVRQGIGQKGLGFVEEEG